MRTTSLLSLTLSLLAAPALAVQDPPEREPDVHWPSFRGARAQGIAEGHATPEAWSVAEKGAILWRVPVAGLAHSSPVIWGDKLFLTTAVRKEGAAELSSLYGSEGYGAGDPVEDEGEHSYRVLCLDKKTGKVLWNEQAIAAVPKVKRHPKATHANSTPACDATSVVAFFGSEGLYCYDHDGKLRWKRDFGVLDVGAPRMREYQWGFASSPIIEGDKVIVQCDIQDQSFLAALSLETGEDVWRTQRDEECTWSTPTVHDAGAKGRAQVVANGYKHIGGYDLETGKEVWKTSGGGDVPVPTPVVVDGLIFLTSAHGRSAPIRAVHADADGEFDTDVDMSPQLAWILPRRGVYMQTLLVYRGLLYACSDGGILSCYDPATGEEHYRERAGDGQAGFSGSPVAADGKLYLTAEDGQVLVVAAGEEYEVIERCDLGETCLSTPAISEGVLYFRTRHHLVAVGE